MRADDGKLPKVKIRNQHGAGLLEMVDLMRRAEGGSVESQYELALQLWRGHEVAADRRSAQEWIERAALQGLSKAQVMMGNIWRLGLTGFHSLRLAAFWYAKAAASDSAEGLYRLAVLYRDEQGLAGNSQCWLSLMQRSAEAGYLRAMLVMADYYLAQRRNWQLAVHWYRVAAASGDIASLYLLGQMFRHGGAGVPMNMTNALVYFHLAAEQGMWQAQVELARTLLFLDQNSSEAVEWLRRGLNADLNDVNDAVRKIRTGQLSIGQWVAPEPPLRLYKEEAALEDPLELTEGAENQILDKLKLSGLRNSQGPGVES